MRDCSDIGKAPIRDKFECQEAAAQLGLIFKEPWYILQGYGRNEIEDSKSPKGCHMLYIDVEYDIVRYNPHEIGSEGHDTYFICEKSGNSILSYYTTVDKTKLISYIVVSTH